MATNPHKFGVLDPFVTIACHTRSSTNLYPKTIRRENLTFIICPLCYEES